MFKGKKVIIFDMDGTLIDSVGIWNETDQILINKLNNKLIKIKNIGQMRDSILAQCKTDNIYLEYCDFLREKYNSNLSAKEILDLRWQISEDYTKNKVDYKTNADKLLHILKDRGYILVLATTTTNIQLNDYKKHNRNIIEKANIDDMFSVIFTQNDVKEKKPNPEVHNKIMKLLNVKPSECLIIEDSLMGVQAGKNAGIEVVSMYDKYSDCDRDVINKLADYSFNSFDEIIDYINKESNFMEKVIVEVGSTNTKFDLYDGKEIKRLGAETIEFKRNYKKQNKLDNEDVKRLINKVNEYKRIYSDIYVCGTSIFRNLTEEQKNEFLTLFLNETGIEFQIINQEKENELTVKGATKEVKGKVAVFVGGGGSTEISIYEDGIKEMVNTPIGVIDIMNKYPDLADDIATTDVETIKELIRQNLKLPKQKADVLIIAGGGHLYFALNSGISYEENTLYKDKLQPIMMDIETRKKDTDRYYKEISLDEIRKKVNDPDWWYATRAMGAFVLVVAEEIGAKYIVPTDISMVHGLL